MSEELDWAPSEVTIDGVTWLGGGAWPVQYETTYNGHEYYFRLRHGCMTLRRGGVLGDCIGVWELGNGEGLMTGSEVHRVLGLITGCLNGTMPSFEEMCSALEG